MRELLVFITATAVQVHVRILLPVAMLAGPTI